MSLNFNTFVLTIFMCLGSIKSRFLFDKFGISFRLQKAVGRTTRCLMSLAAKVREVNSACVWWLKQHSGGPCEKVCTPRMHFHKGKRASRITFS